MELSRTFRIAFITGGLGLALLAGCTPEPDDPVTGIGDDAGMDAAPADDVDNFGEPDISPEPSPPPADIGGNVAPPAPPTQAPGGAQSPGGQPNTGDSGIDVEQR